jgi:hypothetical protein
LPNDVWNEFLFRIRGEFLEREAKLSGSEVGSDDEDEDGLDRLMVEEGDLDDVDEEAVRDEVKNCFMFQSQNNIKSLKILILNKPLLYTIFLKHKQFLLP